MTSTIKKIISASFALAACYIYDPAFAQSVPAFDHIVVVIGENTNQSSIYGNNTNAPYINTLAADGAKFTKSYGVTHPSQPNYLELFSGDNQGVTDDNTYYTSAKLTTANLAAELIAAGKTFITYSEGLPSVGYDGASSGDYVRKHNPAANWMGAGTNQIPKETNQPFTAFPNDFSKLPSVAFVVPDMCNDGHDNCVSGISRYRQFDNWIKTNLDTYKQWCINNNSLLIVTYDEDNFTNTNLIATVFYGAKVKKGSYTNVINHDNVLRFLEDANGLTTHAGAAANASAIDYCWGTGNTAVYCSSTASSATYENISKVVLNNVTKTSSNTTGYSDFTSVAIPLSKSQAYTISITPYWPGTKYNEAYAVYIDYNNDKDFDDAGETVFTKAASQDAVASGSFTVPATATTGATRMRVSMSDAGIPAYCGSFNYGEVEDYTINIQDGSGTISYCTSRSTDTSYEGIKKVVLNTINKSSDRSFYSDFTSVSTSLTAGSAYTISITPSKKISTDNEGYSVYIDYNNNGQFESTELAFSTTSTSASAISGSVSVPATASAGAVRMRVSMKYNIVPGACEAGSWEGEVEDYTVNITAAAPKAIARAGSDASNGTKINEVVTVYPNPVQGNTLYVTGIQNNQQYIIENAAGKRMKSARFNGNKADIGSLPAGVYFIKILSGDSVVNRKFIKE